VAILISFGDNISVDEKQSDVVEKEADSSSEESSALVQESPEPTPVQEEVSSVPALNRAAFETKLVNGYVWGTGRRKTAVARVRLRLGEGKFIINKKDANDYFRLLRDQTVIRTPLQATKTNEGLDVLVSVHGGGMTGQVGAIVLGIARALKLANSDYEPFLRDKGLLSRDPRKVERKKYGQRGARRRFQFSKR